MNKKTSLAYASILLAAATWGLIGLWNRNLFAAGLSPYSIVVVRNCGGLVALLALFAIKDRSVFRIDPKHLKYFFGTGIVSVLLFTLCYFSCQEIASLAVASILLYTAPSIVVVLSALIWKEPFTKGKIAALGLTFLGCTAVTGIWNGAVIVSPLGILLGLGAGLFYALYSIFGRFALAHYPPMTVTVWTFVFCGAGSLFFLRPAELSAAFALPTTWLFALGLVVVSTVSPYIFYTFGLSRVEAGKASIMASLEPVVASMVGTLVFGESITIVAIFGILLILAGIILLKDA